MIEDDDDPDLWSDLLWYDPEGCIALIVMGAVVLAVLASLLFMGASLLGFIRPWGNP